MLVSKKRILFLAISFLVVFGGFSFFLSQEKTPAPILSYDLSSSELGIAASSPLGESGGLVVPASCPSNLHDAPSNYGNACTSSANDCGKTNSGNIQCNGTCSAGPPADGTTSTEDCSKYSGDTYADDGDFICHETWTGTNPTKTCDGVTTATAWNCTGGCDTVGTSGAYTCGGACGTGTYTASCNYDSCTGSNSCTRSACGGTSGAYTCGGACGTGTYAASCNYDSCTGSATCTRSACGGTSGAYTCDGACGTGTYTASCNYDSCTGSNSCTRSACACTAQPTVSTYPCSIWDTATTCYNGTADWVTYCDDASGWENYDCSEIACACVTNGSCSASTPACGSTTYGSDNCGTSCSKTGAACSISPSVDSLTASPNPVAYNTASTLTWSASGGVTACYMTGGIYTTITYVGGASGSFSTGNLTANTTYTANCHNGSVWASNPKSVTVSVGAAPVSPTCSSTGPGTPTTATSGTYSVYAYGVSANVTSVSFPTWGDVGGQDDIVWYSGTNQGGGTWRGDINMANHKAGNPEYGNINVHIYMDAPSHAGTWCGAANFTRNAVAPTLTLSVDSTSIAYNTGTILRWTAGAATWCWGQPFPTVGYKAGTGPEATGNLTTTQTYTMTCGNGNAAQDISKSVTVTVAVAPINGGWSDWGACGGASCGTGTQTRTCTNPAPTNGGTNCVGSANQDCSLGPCCIPKTCADYASQTAGYCASTSRNFTRGCSLPNLSCPGTRYCDFNWKEVAP